MKCDIAKTAVEYIKAAEYVGSSECKERNMDIDAIR